MTIKKSVSQSHAESASWHEYSSHTVKTALSYSDSEAGSDVITRLSQ